MFDRPNKKRKFKKRGGDVTTMNKSQQKGKAKRASLPSSPSSSSSSSSSRSQESGSGSGSGAGSGQAQGSSVCRFFASTGGCWRGGKCKFQHIAPPPDTHSNTTTTTTPAYSDKQCMICYENPDTFALFCKGGKEREGGGEMGGWTQQHTL